MTVGNIVNIKKLKSQDQYPLTTLRPDIAIVIEKPCPMLVGYIGIKTDLGFKRDYSNKFSEIVENIKNIRSAADIGPLTGDGQAIIPYDHLVWRTVFISDQNISSNELALTKEKANEYSDSFKLYFLSGGVHPNDKKGKKLDIYKGEFKRLFQDIVNDITKALIP